MAFDGSLKFDTKVNTDGFEKGTSSLNRATENVAKTAENAGRRVNEAFNKSTKISSLENQIEQTEQKIRDLSAALGEMQTADVPTEEYLELSKLVEKTQLKMDGLIDRQAKLEEQGVSKNSSRWKSLQYDIEETTRMLETYKVELQDTIDRDRAFTSGGDSSAYAKKAEALENLNNKLYVQKQRLSDVISKEGTAATEAARLSDIGKNAEVSNEGIANLSRRLQELNARQKELKSAGVGFGHTEFDSNALEISNLTARIKEYKSSLGGAGEGTKELSTYMNMAADYGKKLLGVVGRLGMSGLGKLGTLAKRAAGSLIKMGKAFLFSNKQMGEHRRGLSGILKQMILYGLIRKIVSGVATAFKEGIQNYAQYSSSFNSVMSSFISSLLQLKNSIAAAFAPIISIAVPILNVLIQKLIQAINVIGQFFSALTGKGTFTKAVKTQEDYAAGIKKTGAAAKKAGKDAQKALAPFDELKELTKKQDSGDSGSSGTDPSEMFTESKIDGGISDFANKIMEAFKAGDFSAIGQIIGEKINDAVQRFTDFISWDNIGAKITNFVTDFTTLFNSLVRTIDWYAIGMMMGTGINTLVNTLYLLLTQINWQILGAAIAMGLNGMIDTVDWSKLGATIGAYFQAMIAIMYGFVSTLNWSGIGKAIGNSLNGMINQIDWAMLGLTLATGLSGLFSIVGNFATTFDWTGFGESIATSLSTFFQNFDWDGAGTAISDIVIGLLDALISFITKTDWAAFGAGVADMLVAIDWATIASRIFEAFGSALGAAFALLGSFVGKLIVDGIVAAKNYFQGKIEECGGNVVLGIFKGIVDAIMGINGWIVTNIFLPFYGGFIKAFAPSSLKDMAEHIWDGFCNGIKGFFSNPVGFIKANITDPFMNGIRNLLGIHSPSTVMAEMGGYTVEGFNQGVENGQSSSQGVVQKWASGISSWFASKLGLSGSNSDESKKWASGIISGYNGAISSDYTKSQSVMEAWASSINKWFTGTGAGKGVNEATWEQFADQIMNAFNKQVQTGNVNTKTPLETWSTNIRMWFWGDSNYTGTGGLYNVFYMMAKRVNEGFANGISDFSNLTKAAMTKWTQGAIEEAKKGLDIHSPSRESYSIAEYFIQGFNNGIADMAKTSENNVRSWIEGITKVLDGADLQLSTGINIPNAASYLPRMSQGIVVPPRAGEYQTTKNSAEGNSFLEGLSNLIQQLKSNGQHGTSDDGNINLTLNFGDDMVYQTVVRKNQQVIGSTGMNPLMG